MTGTIYFARCSVANAVKIGFTTGSPTHRIKQLDTTGTVGEIELALALPGSLRDEAALHRKFADDRIRTNREWFRYSATISQFILGRIFERRCAEAKDRVYQLLQFVSDTGHMLPDRAWIPNRVVTIHDVRRCCADDRVSLALIDAFLVHEREMRRWFCPECASEVAA